MRAQIESVSDVVQVPQVLRLRGKVLGPVPVVKQLLGEGVAVGVTLRVEPAAGITVVVPGSAQPIGRLQHSHIEAQLPGPVQLVDARQTGTDDNDVVFFHLHALSNMQ